MAESVTEISRSPSAPTFVRERVLATLGQRILSSHYPPGSTLPTEAQLCAEFGVSRTAMREAIKMLAAKGLVVSRQRAGTRVQDAASWNRLDTDVLTWMSNVEPDPEFVAGLIALFIGGWLGEKLGERRMAITFFGVWLIFDALILFAIPLRETGWYPPIMAGGWFALDSMLSIGLIAIAMRLCNRTVAATQFTLYMAAANFGTALGAKLFGMATGAADVERLMLIVMGLDALGIVILLAVKMTAPPENAVMEDDAGGLRGISR